LGDADKTVVPAVAAWLLSKAMCHALCWRLQRLMLPMLGESGCLKVRVWNRVTTGFSASEVAILVSC